MNLVYSFIQIAFLQAGYIKWGSDFFMVAFCFLQAGLLSVYGRATGAGKPINLGLIRAPYVLYGLIYRPYILYGF